MNFTLARDRRRFFITRGLRKRRFGTGSDVAALMDLPREDLAVSPETLFGDIPFCVIGGVATRAYMPERNTKDIDFLIGPDDFAAAEQRLRDAGYAPVRSGDELAFIGSMLELFGRCWQKGDIFIDVISSRQPWVHDALMQNARDQRGVRVIGLPYLVLMKLDASRGQDQADLERMLGRLQPAEVDAVVAIVARHLADPQAAEDVRHYALLGQFEYQHLTRDDSEARPQSKNDLTQDL